MGLFDEPDHPLSVYFMSFFRSSANQRGKRRRRRRLSSEINRAMRLEHLEDRRLLTTFTEFIDPHPNPDNRFGDTVVPLNTGNVVVTSPLDDAGGSNAGAVYLFDGATGALISTLTGSSDNDQIGSNGVSALSTGIFW